MVQHNMQHSPEENGKEFPVKGASLFKTAPIQALLVSLFFWLAAGRSPLGANDRRRFVGKRC